MEECMECGDSFDTFHGMSTHYTMMHGKPKTNCDYCGDEISVSLSELDGNNFCSESCYGKSCQKRVDVNCSNCGDQIEIVKSRYNRQEKFFCSDKCYSLGVSGSNNAHYNNGAKVNVNCDNCNDEMEVIPSRENKYDRTFCSIDCKSKAYSGKGNPFYGKSHSEKMKEVMPSGKENWNYGSKLSEETKRKISESHTGKGNPMFGVRGEDAPNWQGGDWIDQSWRRTADWFNVREQALKRDNNECQECGTTDKLHVHHIKPVSEGGSKFDTDNLVTLCKTHHYDRHRSDKDAIV